MSSRARAAHLQMPRLRRTSEQELRGQRERFDLAKRGSVRLSWFRRLFLLFPPLILCTVVLLPVCTLLNAFVAETFVR